MSETIRESILAAFTAQLEEISGISGLTVERNRDTEVQKFPALIVVEGGQTANHENTHLTEYEMTIGVEGYVKAAAASVGSALNTLYGKTVQKALEDNTLGGLCFDITEQDMEIEIDRGEGRAPAMAFLLTFNVKYMTRQRDPFNLAP